jgi:hypothetical protein
MQSFIDRQEPETAQGLLEAFAMAEKNEFLTDVLQRLERNGKLSDKQVNAVLKIRNRLDDELIAPAYKPGQHIHVAVKLIGIEKGHGEFGPWTRYRLKDDLGVVYYLKTGAKKLVSILNVAKVTNDELEMEGDIKWIPDDKKWPVVMSAKKLKLDFVDEETV